jgi:hypothetical protein
MKKRNFAIVSLLVALACGCCAPAQDPEIIQKLDGFDDYMAKVLKDWNGPGIGVGIVIGDKLVFANRHCGGHAG